jgi:NADH-quinone oxidoreductase subunit B
MRIFCALNVKDPRYLINGLSREKTLNSQTTLTPPNSSVEVSPSDMEQMLNTNVMTSKLDKFIAWGRKNALWPLPFGTACCGIEFMSVVGPRYDIARFGAEVVRFSPRQSDLLIIAGTISEKMAPVLKLIHAQMLEPKWVIAMGACASSGGFYRAYHVLQGADKVVPVDIYVPGCPPTPEAVIDGVMRLQEFIASGRKRLQVK